MRAQYTKRCDNDLDHPHPKELFFVIEFDVKSFDSQVAHNGSRSVKNVRLGRRHNGRKNGRCNKRRDEGILNKALTNRQHNLVGSGRCGNSSIFNHITCRDADKEG
jgi:hypothetical protein